MVKERNITAAFFKLIRWPNLLMVAATMILIRFCIIVPMVENSGLAIQLSFSEFLILLFSTLLITSGGYVINDYFDRKTDLINHPDTVIVSRLISRRWAMILHLILTILGLVLGSYLALKTGLNHLILLFFAVSGVLWFYSTTYKRQFLTGNIIVAILTGLVPLMVLLFELPLLGRKYGSVADGMGLDSGRMIGWVLYFSVLAFCVTLIREIVKDTEDIEGDKAYGMHTLPVVIGEKRTGFVTVFLSVVTVILVFYFNVEQKAGLVSFGYLVLFVVIPLLICSYLLIKAGSKKNYHFISSLLKLVMVMGIFYAIVIRFQLFNY
jgi:4-hydroxybenzoate polyprenyltransferase